jgi:hypothetical protein
MGPESRAMGFIGPDHKSRGSCDWRRRDKDRSLDVPFLFAPEITPITNVEVWVKVARAARKELTQRAGAAQQGTHQGR